MVKPTGKKVGMTYQKKRLVEKAIRAHIEAELPKFRDGVALAASLKESLGFTVTTGHINGLFKVMDDLDRTQIIQRAPAGQAETRNPRRLEIKALRTELSQLQARVEKLEAFVNEFKD